MKNNDFTASTKRQLEILEDFYDVDYEHKLINVNLYYSDINEAINTNLNENKLPQFKDSVIQNLSSVITDFPLSFKANIKIECDNLRDYEQEGLLKSLRHSLELFHYSTQGYYKRNFLLATIMFTIGLFALFIMVMSNNYNWTSETNVKEVVTTIIEIISWIFIWEAVSLIVLLPQEYHDINIGIVKRINEIQIVSHERSLSINANQITENYVEDSSKYRVGTVLFLLSGVAFTSASIPNFIRAMVDAYNGVYGNGAVLIVAIIFLIFYTALQTSAGIASLLSFTPKKKRFPRFIRVCSILMITINSIALALAIALVYQQPAPIRLIIPYVFTLAFSIIYLIGYTISKRKT